MTRAQPATATTLTLDEENAQHIPLVSGASSKNSILDTLDPAKPQNQGSTETPYGEKKRVIIRMCVFVTCCMALVVGRLHIPDNAPACVVDKGMDFFQPANDWVLAHPFWRDFMQIVCSLFMDFMFLSLGIYWIYRGKSSRLIVTVCLFYVTRSMIQGMWYSPYTKGYWWEDPGFPSLVVPYGRGSDFFFSGHIGFVTICASEWNKIGNKLMVYLLLVGGVYTGFILITYQVHYSIDLFVGVIFGHWMFMMVDSYKERIDDMFVKIYVKSGALLGRLTNKKKDVEADNGSHSKYRSQSNYTRNEQL